MATTQKISVAMGAIELRLAKRVAKDEGVSLSSYITHAVRERLEQKARLDAARAILSSFSSSQLASGDEQHELLASWSEGQRRTKRSKRPRSR